jgi:hypothetical protein
MARRVKSENKQMRFQYGPIPEDEVFHPEAQGWSGIREPSPLVLNILAIPIGILLMGSTIYALSLAWEGGFPAIIGEIVEQSKLNPFWVFLPVLVISIPVHELVHLFIHPQHGRSKKSILGLWLSRGLFYAHYDGAVSRNRFLAMLAAPYLLLAWLPVIILALIGTSGPIEYVLILAMVALVNGVFPAGDVTGILLLGPYASSGKPET